MSSSNIEKEMADTPLYRGLKVVSWVLSLCSLVCTLVLTVIGTAHKDDECSADQLGLAMMLALIACCINFACFLLFNTPSMFCAVIGAGGASVACFSAGEKITNITHLFSLAISIFVCVEVADTDADKCSKMLYKSAMGYAISFYIGLGIVFAMVVVTLCGACCCASLATSFASQVDKKERRSRSGMA